MTTFATWEEAARAQGWHENGAELRNDNLGRDWPEHDWKAAAEDAGVTPDEVRIGVASTLLYAIIEADQPMDGQFYTLRELMKAIPLADYDAEIAAFDMGELRADKSTPMRLLTEDIVRDWWDHYNGAEETMSRIDAGQRPGLAFRFYPDECEAWERQVEAA